MCCHAPPGIHHALYTVRRQVLPVAVLVLVRGFEAVGLGLLLGSGPPKILAESSSVYLVPATSKHTHIISKISLFCLLSRLIKVQSIDNREGSVIVLFTIWIPKNSIYLVNTPVLYSVVIS